MHQDPLKTARHTQKPAMRLYLEPQTTRLQLTNTTGLEVDGKEDEIAWIVDGVGGRIMIGVHLHLIGKTNMVGGFNR